jgi:hypothetical protein
VPAGALKSRLSCFDEESDDSEPESKKIGAAILVSHCKFFECSIL